MPRRGSYLCSMENPSEVEAGEPGNFLKPPSPVYGNGSARNGSVSSKKSSEKSRNGSVVSNASNEKSYSDYEEKVKTRSPSPAFSMQFRDDVGWPMYLYTTLLGLNEGYFRNHRKYERAYCLFVIIILFVASLRRFEQIGTRQENLPPLSWGQAIFDPTIVLTICNAAFLFSGSMAALFMMFFRAKRREIGSIYKEQIKRYYAERDNARVAKITRLTVIATVIFSFIASSSKLLYKIEALKLPWLPPLITDHWYYWPLEFYVTFLAESSICILTIFFSQSCMFIRHSISNLLKEMIPEGDHEDCPLPEESLRRIRDVQVHHQEILSAKTMLEENFSFVLFYSYGCVIPAICFLGYLILKNISNDNWALHISLAMWILSTLSALLMMSIPAFMIHEDGEKLLSASFKMYHEGLCEERDLLVVSQMTLLVFQIHSAKLTLSASNYFSMNRKILISLFSAIFTYFLILVQFGQTTARNWEEGGGDSTNSTSFLI